MKKFTVFVFTALLLMSCVNTKSTLKNTDDNAPDLQLLNQTTFLISKFATGIKYGYDKDYPVNLFFQNNSIATLNQQRFLNALSGPNGEKISWSKLENCCPFPTKKSEMGVGLLDVYELKWQGQQKPMILYVNSYEKGVLMVPFGLKLKKN